MGSSKVDIEPLASGLTFRDDRLIVHLTDGRELSIPLAFYPTLVKMTPAEREQWELLGRGEGFDWPDYDLQLSVRGFLAGHREHVPPASFRAKHPRPIDLKRREG